MRQGGLREIHDRQPIAPIVLVMINKWPQRLIDPPIIIFRLPVRLRVPRY